jgi:hypothetical protein
MSKKTNITKEHEDSFNAMVSGKYDNFALFSCFVNGTPTSAIVSINKEGPEYIVVPLFVAITDDMKITDHDGTEPRTNQ